MAEVEAMPTFGTELKVSYPLIDSNPPPGSRRNAAHDLATSPTPQSTLTDLPH